MESYLNSEPKKPMNLKVGHHLTADIFEVGKMVDVTGTSKGKGYAGVIKDIILQCKMQHMVIPWHIELMVQLVSVRLLEEFGKERKCLVIWGYETKTIQSLELMGADVQNNLLYVKRRSTWI